MELICLVIVIAAFFAFILFCLKRKKAFEQERLLAKQKEKEMREEKIKVCICSLNELAKDRIEYLKFSLLDAKHYFAYSECEKEKADSVQLLEYWETLKQYKATNREELSAEAKEYVEMILHIDDERSSHNKEFVKNELAENKEFFDTALSYPLDPQQRESIVKLEDNCLVISSAGSGKTSTMIGKLLYLVHKRGIQPSRILTITYTHKAADELTSRLLGTGLNCMTFHKLAMNIVGKVEGDMPTIAENDLFLNVFYHQMERPEFRSAMLIYLTDYKSLVKAEHDYDIAFEYYSDRKKYGILALYTDKDGRAIATKSEEERKICSYLTELGVKFKYEEPYEYKTMTEEYRQYKPDFSIYYEDEEGNPKRLYLEHFGINAARKVPRWFGDGTPGGWHAANERYLEGIDWKINTHVERGTRLIYTTSAEFHNKTIRQRLRHLLELEGVPIKEPTNDELLEMIFSRNKSAENALLQLIQSFVNLVKANDLSLEDICEKAKGSIRDLFVINNIIRPIWEEYQNELNERGEMDFTDVINKAAHYCNDGKWNQHYEYILIDEFQDISIDRYRFLLSLRSELPKTKLYCVGDDWQSIYRFTGSDMALFAEFPKFFGYTEECRIETTYRFGNPLIAKSSEFVQGNPMQKKKNVRPRLVKENEEQPETKISYMSYKTNEELGSLLERMIARVPKDKSAYIISRYTHDVRHLASLDRKLSYNANDDTVTISFAGRNIKFMTIHGSKGLEADYVFVINCNSGLYGFPSLISDDPILDYVLSDPEHFEYAEERRVFYVGITRAKVHTVVLYNEATPSPFVCEMDKDVVSNPDPCPMCRTGHRVVKYEGWAKNKTPYRVWGCDNREARCQYFYREFYKGDYMAMKGRTVVKGFSRS